VASVGHRWPPVKLAGLLALLIVSFSCLERLDSAFYGCRYRLISFSGEACLKIRQRVHGFEFAQGIRSLEAIPGVRCAQHLAKYACHLEHPDAFEGLPQVARLTEGSSTEPTNRVTMRYSVAGKPIFDH
jgi:hypothetical protein